MLLYLIWRHGENLCREKKIMKNASLLTIFRKILHKIKNEIGIHNEVNLEKMQGCGIPYYYLAIIGIDKTHKTTLV